MTDFARYRIILALALVTVGPGVTAAEELYAITGSEDDPLLLPTDVVASPSQVCVVDSGHHRIACFDSRGRPLRTFGSRGNEPGQFDGPVGIGLGQNGSLYVADSGNRRVQVFSATGELVRVIPVATGGEAIRPIDVAVAATDGAFFVTGNTNHRVLVYSAAGKLIRTFGGNGTELGQFRYPATIATTPDGRLAVVDVLNGRIQVFARSGELSFQLGSWGVTPGQLFRPKGIAVAPTGSIFVSDSYLGFVQAYTDAGQFVGLVTDASRRPRKLRTPAGIFVDGDRRLYVAQMLAHRVSVYRLDGG